MTIDYNQKTQAEKSYIYLLFLRDFHGISIGHWGINSLDSDPRRRGRNPGRRSLGLLEHAFGCGGRWCFTMGYNGIYVYIY